MLLIKQIEKHHLIDEDKVADGEERQSINYTNININNTWLLNMLLLKK